MASGGGPGSAEKKGGPSFFPMWTKRSEPPPSMDAVAKTRPAPRPPPAPSFGPDAMPVPWLSQEYYQEAASIFNIYDPNLWMPTIKYSIGEFMFWPWILINTWSICLTVFFKVISPEYHEFVEMPIDAHTILGATISFLVVFRTDGSMDRWSEARASWQTIINCCLSVGAQTAPALDSEQACEKLLMELMAFVVSLKATLRETTMMRDEVGGRMDWSYISRLNKSKNPPLQALKTISETVRLNLPKDNPNTTTDESKLSSAIYDEVSEQIRVINHAVGTCKRVKNTPMTYGYVTTLRSFLVLWLTSLPIALIGELGWFSPFALMVLSYLFLNVEQMSVEIENPFGEDANDLPLEQYIMELEETLLEMLPGFTLPDGSDDEGDPPPPSMPLPPPPQYMMPQPGYACGGYACADHGRLPPPSGAAMAPQGTMVMLPPHAMGAEGAYYYAPPMPPQEMEQWNHVSPQWRAARAAHVKSPYAC